MTIGIEERTLFEKNIKITPYYENGLPKKIPFPLICSDLCLTLKKAPFSENRWTSMLMHIVKVVPPQIQNN